MNQLYCGACQNYLMGSDGECHDCSCGWKQPIESSDIESLKAENVRLQSECNSLIDVLEPLMEQCVKQIHVWNFSEYDHAVRVLKRIKGEE